MTESAKLGYNKTRTSFASPASGAGRNVGLLFTLAGDTTVGAAVGAAASCGQWSRTKKQSHRCSVLTLKLKDLSSPVVDAGFEDSAFVDEAAVAPS